MCTLQTPLLLKNDFVLLTIAKSEFKGISAIYFLNIDKVIIPHMKVTPGKIKVREHCLAVLL